MSATSKPIATAVPTTEGKLVKKVAVSKKTVAAAATTVPVAAVTETKASEAEAETATDTTLTPEEELAQGFQEIFSKVIDITTAAKSLNQTAKALFKRYAHFVRTQKTTKRKKPTTETGETVKPKPSGFMNPVTLSPEMYAFLNVAPGTEMTRTHVTKLVYDYIVNHELQNPENRRIILPNATLRELLKVPEDAELTYFNIQTYLKPHFVKKAAAPAAQA